MNGKRMIWAICLLLAFFMASCATAPKSRLNEAEATKELGEAYMSQGNFTAALRELLKAEALNPGDPFLQHDIGLAYLAKERPGMAIKHLQKALKIKPDYAPAKNTLGLAYLAQGEWDSAIDCFKELSGNLLYATPHYALSNLGWAYYNKKDYRLAEKYYLKALEVKPPLVHAMKGLGNTYLATGRITEAIVTFEKAIGYHPLIADLHYDLAKAYALSNEHQNAIKAYRKVVELSPDTPLSDKAEIELQKIKGLKRK